MAKYDRFRTHENATQPKTPVCSGMAAHLGKRRRFRAAFEILADEGEVRKTPSFLFVIPFHNYSQNRIFLPRQARDKQTESSKIGGVFVQVAEKEERKL